MNKVFDYKGNEIKEGMIIYFVQTKNFFSGKLGLVIPLGNGKYREIFESDEDQYKRNNEELWILGSEHEVLNINNSLWYRIHLDEYIIDTPLLQQDNIAIKGISDIKDAKHSLIQW